MTDRREVRVAAFKPLKWGSLREKWEVEREETVVVVEEEAEIGDKEAAEEGRWRVRDSRTVAIREREGASMEGWRSEK